MANWDITFCAGYIVPPCKHLGPAETRAQLQGSAVALNAQAHDYFYPHFVRAWSDCTIQVAFLPNPDDDAPHTVRGWIRDLAFGTPDQRTAAAESLAVQLGLATDRRSPEGLFVTLTGRLGEQTRVVLYKFPADDSLQALFVDGQLEINVIEGAFSRTTDFFKAAVFKGKAGTESFWEGRVEDRQANRRIYEVSDLWVIGFLNALPRLTGPRGSRLLAKALRRLAARAKSPEEQRPLVTAARQARLLADQEITLQSFAENYLPLPARAAFLSEIGHSTLTEAPFVVQGSVMDEQLGVRTLVLDNQFSITGPLDAYPEALVIKRLATDDEVEITLRGRIVSNRLNTTQRLPKG